MGQINAVVLKINLTMCAI